MMLRVLIPLIFLLAPGPLYASQWLKGCSTGQTTNSVTRLDPLACTRPSSASDDPEIITVSTCDNIDVMVEADENGDGTGADALQATLQACGVNQGDGTVNTDGERDNACTNYSNTMTGDGIWMGAGVPSGRVRINLGGSFAGDPIIWLKCNFP